MNNEICGIYKIENIINFHKYIGQAIDIKKRWREHKSNAFNQNSKDYDMVIYRAIRKYGLENFSFEIIEVCNPKELNDKEVYWIEYYNSYYDGYNCSKGGNDYTHLGNEIDLYDFNGNYVKSYDNIATAARELDVHYETLYQVIKGIRHSCKGYQVKLKNENKEIKQYKNRQGGKIPVEQLDDDNNVLNIFESSYDAARKLNLDPSSIIKCCKGKLKHVGGFKWRYQNNEL